MLEHNQTRVLLPAKLREQAQSNEHYKQLILGYIKIGYPTYRVMKVVDGYAICER